MHRSLRRIICSCIVPHEFKSRTVTVASVVIIFSSTRYALRVSCKIDGFRSKDIYFVSVTSSWITRLIVNFTAIHFPSYRSSVFFFPRFMVHLQSSSIHCTAIYTHSLSFQFPISTCSCIQTPYQPSSHIFALLMFHSFSFNLCICALHSWLIQYPPIFRVLAHPAFPFHTLFFGFL